MDRAAGQDAACLVERTAAVHIEGSLASDIDERLRSSCFVAHTELYTHIQVEERLESMEDRPGQRRLVWFEVLDILTIAGCAFVDSLHGWVQEMRGFHFDLELQEKELQMICPAVPSQKADLIVN